MRERLTKQAMGKNDSPTTMDVQVENPSADKYETGNPESWAEGVNMDRPWEAENSAGREETGHPKMKAKANTYASMVREAKELEAKAMRCLKMAETILPDATVDVIEKQAVDFMTMSSNSVNSTLRRMREFDEVISEARVAKIVDAVMEVMAEEKEEEKEEVKEEVKEAKEEVKEEEKEEEKEDEDTKIATIVEAVLEVLAEEEKEEEKEEKEDKCASDDKDEEEKEEEKEVKEASKEEVKEEEEEVKEASDDKDEEEKEEEKEEVKEAAKEEEEEEEEVKEASAEISFDELGDVMASKEDEQLLSQIFTADEAPKEEIKEAKIKTLKNVTASKGANEIDKLASLWRKDY